VSPDHVPHVSIIIPVFNQGSQLLACLRALKGQTYQDGTFEVIVVDNGSDPPIDHLTESFSFARCIREPKPGSYAARNQGIKASRGELLAFTDADCVPEADWIERGVSAMRGLPGHGMIGGRVELTFRNLNRLAGAELFEAVFGFPQEHYIKQLGFSVTANLFTSRATVDDVGLFDESLMSGGDVEWGQRVRSRGLAQEYAADVRIAHAARGTLSELCKQSLRVAGGVQQIADRRGQGTAGLLAHAMAQLVLLGNIRANLSDERLAGFSRTLRFAAVVWLVELLRIFERYRVHYGGTPWRT
jgi:glycosyltransferase involved in cell wall biosynthesis